MNAVCTANRSNARAPPAYAARAAEPPRPTSRAERHAQPTTPLSAKSPGVTFAERAVTPRARPARAGASFSQPLPTQIGTRPAARAPFTPYATQMSLQRALTAASRNNGRARRDPSPLSPTSGRDDDTDDVNLNDDEDESISVRAQPPLGLAPSHVSRARMARVKLRTPALQERVLDIDWLGLYHAVERSGAHRLPRLLSANECAELVDAFVCGVRRRERAVARAARVAAAAAAAAADDDDDDDDDGGGARLSGSGGGRGSTPDASDSLGAGARVFTAHVVDVVRATDESSGERASASGGASSEAAGGGGGGRRRRRREATDSASPPSAAAAAADESTSSRVAASSTLCAQLAEPLPALVDALRQRLWPWLQPLANRLVRRAPSAPRCNGGPYPVDLEALWQTQRQLAQAGAEGSEAAAGAPPCAARVLIVKSGVAVPSPAVTSVTSSATNTSTVTATATTTAQTPAASTANDNTAAPASSASSSSHTPATAPSPSSTSGSATCDERAATLRVPRDAAARARALDSFDPVRPLSPDNPLPAFPLAVTIVLSRASVDFCEARALYGHARAPRTPCAGVPATASFELDEGDVIVHTSGVYYTHLTPRDETADAARDATTSPAAAAPAADAAAAADGAGRAASTSSHTAQRVAAGDAGQPCAAVWRLGAPRAGQLLALELHFDAAAP